MDRRYPVAVALVAIGIGVFAFTTVWSPQAPPPDSDQTYPAGAGPDHINVSAPDANDANVPHTPREYWDSYAISYTAPPERRLVEGDYYINATTGEIVAERWNNATVYINGSTYAFVQPADGIPNERQREELHVRRASRPLPGPQLGRHGSGGRFRERVPERSFPLSTAAPVPVTARCVSLTPVLSETQ